MTRFRISFESSVDNNKVTATNSKKSSNSYSDPAGYSSSVYQHKPVTSHQKKLALKNKKDEKSDADDEEKSLATLKLKKAWEVALAPGKNFPMQMFMMWMSGNTVQIFSMMIVGMLIFSSIKAILSWQARSSQDLQQTLNDLLIDPLIYPKLVYLLLQFANLGLGIYKVDSMGLLPTTQSDWLAFLKPKEFLENVVGGIKL
ncbi:hypothetical protein HK099_005563 [Clydaea vesicula]|uniref:ER membrane protein complex subunit 4 n=1 Tax=Clydaea vesicula TaxID=447962 RepID=A0AAD5Y123_9FUNG|nr:hypothetical protein HK099_005563 [Clydaea vesicula]